MADNPNCPACRHVTRKHGPDGCNAVVGCWCDMTPAAINAPATAPEPAPRCPDGHGPFTTCGYCAPAAPTVVPAAPTPVAKPRPVRPVKATAPAAQPTGALLRGASWLCEPCGWSDTEPGPHCGRAMAAVWVTVTRREVA